MYAWSGARCRASTCVPDSPTYLQWHAATLTEANGRALFIPAGCAHGFQTLEDDTEVLYQISVPYEPSAGRGVRWNDPRFGIVWPDPPPSGRIDVSTRCPLSGLRTVTRVIVTGATGFIGRGALAPLLARGLEVHAVTSRMLLPDEPAGVHWHHADLLAPPAARELMAEIAPSHLLHLAWYAEPGAFWNSPENLHWVEASLRLLRRLRRRGWPACRRRRHMCGVRVGRPDGVQ